jgi:hypothetical protein
MRILKTAFAAALLTAATANQVVEDEVYQRCITYDFAGSKICVGDLLP